MKTLKSFLLLFFVAMMAATGMKAQDLIDGYKRVLYADELMDGKAYFLISDRTKYAGNNTGKPKGMSYKLDSYKISWDKPSDGIFFVYWGDFDEEEEGFQWIAEKVGDDQWAFKNKVKGEYIGVKNSYDDDVLFSPTPIGYTLTDLDDGLGRFYMTSSDNSHSPHVQGYLRSDRPNNSLAKQNVGDDDYPGDGATAGYPGRWKLMKVNPGEEEPSDFFTVANGYYNIVLANGTEKRCWTDLKADAPAYEEGASLILNKLYSGDPRNIYRIEAVNREKGLYNIRNYVTGKYVSGSLVDGLAYMTDDAEEPLLFLRSLALNANREFSINSVDGEMFTPVVGDPYTHIGTEGVIVETWKAQKVDISQFESPGGQLKLELAKKMDEVGHPDFGDYSNLSEEQRQAFRKLWEKANEDLQNGTADIIYQSDIANLDAAAKGEYTEPVYDKYHEKLPLRVLSYNVKHCAGNKDGLNLARTARVIAAQNADVVALQEVDSVFSSRSDYKYQIKELAEATGMYGIFCSALTGYGIGILSKELPLSIKVVSLTSDFEPRRMLMAEYNNYVFASLHVGLSAAARRGSGPIIKAAAEEWVPTGKPLIIAGDFNDDGTDAEMEGARGVLTKYLQENGFTYHSDLTTPTWSDGIYVIDNIISYDPIGGVEKVSYEVVNDKVTSDHMPIVGDFIIGFDDPTGIESIQNTKFKIQNDESVYDLQGRRIDSSLFSDSLEPRRSFNERSTLHSSLQKGVYIIGGKKVLR